MPQLLRVTPTAWVHLDAAKTIRNESYARSSVETGGVLLGYWTRNRRHVVIQHAVGPGPAAIHAADVFHPDSAFQRREIAHLYEASGRITTYLGDWHTHPAGGAGLSWRDRLTMRRISLHTRARAQTPLMGIVVPGDSCAMTIWQWQPGAWIPPRVPGPIALPVRFFG